MAYPYTHTYRSGSVTEAQYNQDHQDHIDNNIPTSIDDYSSNVAAMQATTSPGGLGTESLATTLAGEIERLRYMIKLITGQAQWYIDPGLTLSAAQFASGTSMIFRQTSAPSGWTKVAAGINDSALRVVTGAVTNGGSSTSVSGGSNAFSTVMAQTTVGAHTLTTAEIPAHVHPEAGGGNFYNDVGGFSSLGSGGNSVGRQASTGANTGGGGSHDHTIALSMQYVDVIVAVKT